MNLKNLAISFITLSLISCASQTPSISKSDYEQFSKAIYRIETGISFNEYEDMVNNLIDNVDLENQTSRKLLDMFQITGSAWNCKFSGETLERIKECMMVNFSKLKNIAPDIDDANFVHIEQGTNDIITGFLVVLKEEFSKVDKR